MIQQILYVEYIGGCYEYWYYSDGRTYKNSTHDYEHILNFYRKNGFTKIVRTEEAKNVHTRQIKTA